MATALTPDATFNWNIRIRNNASNSKIETYPNTAKIANSSNLATSFETKLTSWPVPNLLLDEPLLMSNSLLYIIPIVLTFQNQPILMA